MPGRSDPALQSQAHRTVSRVATILETAAATPDGVRLTDVTKVLDAPKSSVHGLLRGLVAVGYLEDRNGRFTVGRALHSLLAVSERPSLAEVGHDLMVELREELQETVVLGHRMGDSIVYFHAVESLQLIKYSAQLNQRRPVYPTSMGKIYLADLPDQELEEYLAHHVKSKRQRQAALDDLRQVRRTRVAINRNQTLPGLFGAAAGIRERGELVACLSVVGPTDRMGRQSRKIVAAVRAAADHLTGLLD